MFIQNLKDSQSAEARFMINLVQNDPKSRTFQNIKFLNEISQDNCMTVSQFEWRQILPRKTLPPNESWRISWLGTLLNVRKTKDFSSLNLNEQQAEEMLISLCIT